MRLYGVPGHAVLMVAMMLAGSVAVYAQTAAPTAPAALALQLQPGTAPIEANGTISGDTLVYDDLKSIPQRFPGVDLALLHLGGTRILGVFKVTMDGKDGVQLMQIIQPKKAIPIHYDDYDVFKSPLSDFAREVKAAGLDRQVVYLAHGETYTFTPSQR